MPSTTTTLIAMTMSMLAPAAASAPLAFGAAATTTMGLKRYQLHFDFPKVPFWHGVAHMHTIEHVAGTHAVGVPWFRIHNVCPPRYVLPENGTASVEFSCSSLGRGLQRVHMFSERPDFSTLVFKDPDSRGRVLLVARMRVTPIDTTGHRLWIDATMVRGASWVTDIVLPLSAAINAAEDHLCWGTPFTEHPRLALYRNMIMRKYLRAQAAAAAKKQQL